MLTPSKLIADHWFLALAPIVLAVDSVVANSGPIDGLVAFGVIFDLVLLLPVLYLLCYRKRTRGAIVRALGLACLGVWAATKLIPEADRALLSYLEPLRFVGLAVLVVLELAVVRVIYQSLSAGDGQNALAKKLADNSDTPEWVSRLLAWEAVLWRKLFSFVRSVLSRNRDDV